MSDYKIIGIEETIANMQKVIENLELKITPDVMRDAVNDLLNEARNEAPLKFGNLRASGRAEVKEEGGKIVGEVSFGSESVKYAIVQHERLNFHHNIGKAKYLEDPFKRNWRKYVSYFIEATKRFLR